MGIENGEYSGVLLWVPGWGWLGRVNLKLRKQPLPTVICRPVPKAMMLTSHCSNQGRGRFSRRPQNFMTPDSPCGVLSDSAKQLASSSSKLCILGLTEVKVHKICILGFYLLYFLFFLSINFLKVYKVWL